MLERSLQQRQLDIAITPIDDEVADGIRKVKLFSEPFVVALPASGG
jgi:DNA-binding transcriptional LysR family regulator